MKKKNVLYDLYRIRRHRREKSAAARILLAALVLTVVMPLGGCGKKESGSLEEKTVSQDTSVDSYGVFLGVDANSFHIEDFAPYDMVVVDAQELRKEQLAQLHAGGRLVYSYLNVGSVEESRDYFGTYRDLFLDQYENWPDEYWVDVTDERWQEFVSRELPDAIRRKDPKIDGLFLDNLDIYSHVLEKKTTRDRGEDTYNALGEILEGYSAQNLPVLVNGADEFVEKLLEEDRASLILGVNQETVFTRILDYKKDRFGTQKKSETQYYTEYLEKCKKAGLSVFLLEYTSDDKIAEQIMSYCGENGFRYYISGHVNLSPSNE